MCGAAAVFAAPKAFRPSKDREQIAKDRGAKWQRRLNFNNWDCITL